MNKSKLIFIIVILITAATYTITSLRPKKIINENSKLSKIEKNSYWTCSMHPQIHSEKPGECPICHMQLIKVKAQSEDNIQATNSSNRSVVHATEEQMEMIGIQTHKVERMNLVAHIPISGRMVSSNSVAFQIYESDIRYIKAGLHFKGHTSLAPDIELSGIITSVDNIVDSTSRTIRIVGTVKNNLQNLASETSFRGEILLELNNRVAIPESSVLHTGSGDLVYLVDQKGKLSAKKISLGLKTDSYYEVIDGLNEADTISSGPNFLIDSEAKIRGAN